MACNDFVMDTVGLPLRRIPSQDSWQEVLIDGTDDTFSPLAKTQESDGISHVEQGNWGATQGSARPQRQPPISNDDLRSPACIKSMQESQAMANELRDDLCLTRVRLDSERNHYDVLRGVVDDAYRELASFLELNPRLEIVPQSTAQQLQRLRCQAKLASDCFLEQLGVVQEVEATLMEFEAQISALGVWFVHIPDFNNEREERSDHESSLAVGPDLSNNGLDLSW